MIINRYIGSHQISTQINLFPLELIIGNNLIK